ncbi:MAG: serine hydroxymethyltransferase [Lentisphaerae bacterium]|jgi:glycine hydroxymethyltransferase|nr:serine hydroxymethyltransferase [Lentisphaerota bacterium]MBT4821281.1 serine hydroxymethyltransferase [Lentisphaerota bacterium]MBT5604421.1 serine hydroxymethyltransferase [Lentisphaerota bacterium]MBT7058178.1 serine hydroxymethyltransferase [Lentisphaerota bacterium]MBT7847438.1 serine hydroxymethyltransferase [Lentisphaerota bacterium]
MDVIRDWHGSPITLGIATDHGGVAKKALLIEYLSGKGYTVKDLGPKSVDPEDDYPDFASKLGWEMAGGDIDCGILICRSGLGMSIAANRFHGVRAALAESTAKAAISRKHNCSNVLVTGGDDMSDTDLIKTVDAWLDTPYSGAERHSRRLLKVEQACYDDVAAVRAVDPEIAAVLDDECDRQDEGLELIASENFASPAVRAAAGSVMTNKYAEGYPGKRYYNGCECVDEAERLAVERACRLFGAEAANVQTHSGTQANMAVYFALLEPQDTVLAMSLDHGGHLSHGLGVNFSGRMYNFVGYGVDPETEALNYDTIAALADKHKPKMVLAGASAYPRTIDFPRLREIADSIDALLVVDMAHIAGLVAAGCHPSPVPYADVVTSTTHKTLRGPRGGLILAREKLIKKINSQVFPGIQGGPLMHVIAAKAVCFQEALQPEFKAYQEQVVVNAAALANALAGQGFRIVSGGTDNHLMLVDMRPKSVTGKAAATALDSAGITVNKNLIPFDPESPFVTSGVRVGSPAVTTRGMKEPEMGKIAAWIARVIDDIGDPDVAKTVRDEIAQFTRDFPLPQFLV